MKTLADEILEALPGLMDSHPKGAAVEDISNLIYAPAAHVRAAMLALHTSARASLARWPGSKRRYLVPVGHDFGQRRRACPHCHLVFTLNPNDAPCCSKSCGSQHWWNKASPEERAARTAPVIANSRTPEARAKTSARTKARAADPAVKAALSERTKAWWANPANAAVLAAKIQKVASDPVRRRAMSERRKKDWQDPAFREKLVSAHRAVAATPEYRARRSETLKAVWAHPVTGETMRAATRKNIARAVDAVRGKKQTPEQVRKRVEAARRTRALNRASRPTVQDRILPALACGPLGVRELEAALPGSYRQTIYAALHEMKLAGAVQAIRDGRNVRYALVQR
jgi:hypothetical protein